MKTRIITVEQLEALVYPEDFQPLEGGFRRYCPPSRAAIQALIANAQEAEVVEGYIGEEDEHGEQYIRALTEEGEAVLSRLNAGPYQREVTLYIIPKGDD